MQRIKDEERIRDRLRLSPSERNEHTGLISPHKSRELAKVQSSPTIRSAFRRSAFDHSPRSQSSVSPRTPPASRRMVNGASANGNSSGRGRASGNGRAARREASAAERKAAGRKAYGAVLGLDRKSKKKGSSKKSKPRSPVDKRIAAKRERKAKVNALAEIEAERAMAAAMGSVGGAVSGSTVGAYVPEARSKAKERMSGGQNNGPASSPRLSKQAQPSDRTWTALEKTDAAVRLYRRSQRSVVTSAAQASLESAHSKKVLKSVLSDMEAHMVRRIRVPVEGHPSHTLPLC